MWSMLIHSSSVSGGRLNPASISAMSSRRFSCSTTRAFESDVSGMLCLQNTSIAELWAPRTAATCGGLETDVVDAIRQQQQHLVLHGMVGVRLNYRNRRAESISRRPRVEITQDEDAA